MFCLFLSGRFTQILLYYIIFTLSKVKNLNEKINEKNSVKVSNTCISQMLCSYKSGVSRLSLSISLAAMPGNCDNISTLPVFPVGISKLLISGKQSS